MLFGNGYEIGIACRKARVYTFTKNISSAARDFQIAVTKHTAKQGF